MHTSSVTNLHVLSASTPVSITHAPSTCLKNLHSISVTDSSQLSSSSERTSHCVSVRYLFSFPHVQHPFLHSSTSSMPTSYHSPSDSSHSPFVETEHVPVSPS